MHPTPEEIARALQLLDFLAGGAASATIVEHTHVGQTQTAAVVPPPPGAVVTPLDSTGLPWDERIHSSAKSTNNDGTWKKRRGVQESMVKTVETELRAANPAPPPPPPAATTAVVPPPPVAGAVVPPPPAAQPGTADRNTFVGFMEQVTGLLAGQRLTREQLLPLVTATGLPNIPALATRPDLIPQVNAGIDALLLGV